MKFITDGMLGRLTRWLRMLGHDVEYFRSTDDRKLIEKAKSDERILLTRDLNLYQKALTEGVDTALVEASTRVAKLADLARRFNFKLEIDINVSRCPKCNTKIKPVSKDMVINRVFKTTSTYYTEFWGCPECGQIYWQGAHWKRIERTLKEAKMRARASTRNDLTTFQ